MKIDITRKYFNTEYTIGKLFINGKYFCDTLEDCDRGLDQAMSESEIAQRKKYGITAIPTGTYKVVLTQSQKFGRLLPEILNVKGYKGVRMHSGNTAENSLGCVLIGENKKKGMVINSRLWEDKLVAEFKKAKVNNESVTLTIKK